VAAKILLNLWKVHIVVNMSIMIFCIVMPCSLVCGCQW